jgi:hypothetical protein
MRPHPLFASFVAAARAHKHLRVKAGLLAEAQA